MFEQYLTRYASPEIELGPGLLPQGPWQYVLVIPAMGESAHIEQTLQSVSDAAIARTLVLLVINGRVNSEPSVHESNAIVLKKYSGYKELSERVSVLGIDRASEGLRFGEKEGVGTARKIGCDLALWLFANGAIKTPWIFTTDGDARIASDYFSHDLGEEYSAQVFSFRHSPPRLESALYETHLRYYRLGLAFANSPYAFHTVGSTMAVHAHAYAKVRGFPNRNAAEDFYLLNKLAKVGRIKNNPSCITLSSRDSTRVPFGTGMSHIKIAQAPESYLLYHPEIFSLLKIWLAHFDLNSLPDSASSVLRVLGAESAIETAKQTRKTERDRLRHLHVWFDSFLTLRFAHLMRDTHFPSLPFVEALHCAPFVSVSNTSNVFELAQQIQVFDERALASSSAIPID